MNNQERANRLAEIFGWRQRQPRFYSVPFPHDGSAAWETELFDGEVGLLPWLLRELPKRGFAITLNMIDGNWNAYVSGASGGRSLNADPLLALVDAVVAAHGEKT